MDVPIELHFSSPVHNLVQLRWYFAAKWRSRTVLFLFQTYILWRLCEKSLRRFCILWEVANYKTYIDMNRLPSTARIHKSIMIFWSLENSKNGYSFTKSVLLVHSNHCTRIKVALFWRSTHSSPGWTTALKYLSWQCLRLWFV